MGKIIFAAAAALLFISCEELPTNPELKNEIKILNPLNNSTVKDSANIVIFVPDEFNPVRVELFINHELWYNFKEPPYEHYWDTRYFEDGSQHILEAKAYDKNANVLESKPTIINVYRFMPSFFRGKILNDSLILLTWIDNSSIETGFEIEHSKFPDSSFTKIADIDSNVTEYLVKGDFNLNNFDYFRIRAVKESILSGYAFTQAVYDLANPTNISLKFNSDTSAVISWTDNSSFEEGFEIELYENNSIKLSNTIGPNSNSTEINFNFHNGFLYSVRVASLLKLKKSYSPFVYSNFVINPPEIISIEGLSDSDVKIKVAGKNSYTTGFIIERSHSNQPFAEVGIIAAGQLEFLDNNLDTNFEYKYRAKASTKINSSDPSQEKRCGFLPYIFTEREINAEDFGTMGVSADGKYAAIGGSVDNFTLAVKIYDLTSGSKKTTCIQADSIDYLFEDIDFNYDNSIVAAGSYDKYVTLWDVNSGNVLKRLNSGNYNQHVLMHPKKSYLATSADGKVYVWDYISGNIVTQASYNSPAYISTNSKGDILVTKSAYQDIKLLDFISGTTIKTLAASSTHYYPTLSDDEKFLYAANGNRLFIWDLENLTVEEYSLPVSSIAGLSIHPDNFLILNNEIGASIFDLKTKKISNKSSIKTHGKSRLVQNGAYYMTQDIRKILINKVSNRWQIPIL